MNFSIAIDKVKCIKCGKCAKVCPSAIMRQPEKNAEIELHHPETCIKCGHCVAVCPTGAVLHSNFPADRVHKIDTAALPSVEQTMLLIKSRRSNRAFTNKQVPVELLDIILEAAHRAPTASNMQQVRFTIVTDPELLYKISSITLDTFSAMAKRLGSFIVKPFIKRLLPDVYRMLPRFAAMKESFANGKDPILRGAKAVVFIHAPKSSRFGCQDSNLAYQNG